MQLPLEYRMWRNRMRDKIPMKFAWLLPKRVAMWAAIRVVAHATTGKYGNTEVPKLSAMDAIDRFNKDHKIA